MVLELMQFERLSQCKGKDEKKNVWFYVNKIIILLTRACKK